MIKPLLKNKTCDKPFFKIKATKISLALTYKICQETFKNINYLYKPIFKIQIISPKICLL